MCLKILIKSIRKLIKQDSNDQSDFGIIILPIVNLDGHSFISRSYTDRTFHTNKYKRKNMNDSFCDEGKLY